MERRRNPPLPTHPSQLFSWQGRCGYADMSDLQFIRGRVAGRCTDAPGVTELGFYVRSHKTGAEKLFVEAGARVMEGDVVSWLYKTTDGFTIEIFND
jgi:hypothetical protein